MIVSRDPKKCEEHNLWPLSSSKHHGCPKSIEVVLQLHPVSQDLVFRCFLHLQDRQQVSTGRRRSSPCLVSKKDLPQWERHVTICHRSPTIASHDASRTVTAIPCQSDPTACMHHDRLERLPSSTAPNRRVTAGL